MKERQKGVEVCLGIKDERVHQVELLGEVRHVQLDQGQKSEGEHAEFWSKLKGDKSMVQPAVADSVEDDKKAMKDAELFHLHESEDGKKTLTIEKVKGGPLRAALDPTDTFVLVCPSEIYAWIGSKASEAERKNAMIKAQAFIRTQNKPNWTPVTRVVQGAEPQLFKSKFADWNDGGGGDKPSLELISMRKGMSSGRNIAKHIKEDSPADIARKVMVCDPKELTARTKEEADKKRQGIVSADRGKLSVWRIANFKKVRGRSTARATDSTSPEPNPMAKTPKARRLLP